MRRAAVIAGIVGALVVAALVVPATARRANPYPLDGVLHLQDVQMLGTHNSFHRRPSRAILPNGPADYEHPPLKVQLGDQGIRSLEFDAYNGPLLPVFHSIIVDDQSNCPTLKGCLQIINAWSRANPGHLTLVLFVEPKVLPTNPGPGIQSIIDNVVTQQGLANWDAAGFERIDTTVRDVFRRKLVTPDEVRGKRATLRDAILRDGWPTLGELRGRVLVVLNVADGLRDLYLAGAPTLEGKAMFVPSAPTEPSAAIVKRDVPQPNHFPNLARRSFFVKTRADADAVEARARDLTRATVAITSGANIVATDYPVADPTIGDYAVELPGTAVARCNPVTAPKRCRDTDLENTRGLHHR